MSSLSERPFRLVHLPEESARNVLSQLRVEAPAKCCGVSVERVTELAPDKAWWEPRGSDAPPLLLVQRTVWQHSRRYPGLISAAVRHRIPIVYDVDDLLLKIPDDHAQRPYHDHLLPSTLAATLQADVITVSTEPLQRMLEPFHPHVRVVPNRLPPWIWETLQTHLRPRVAAADDRIRVGYMASRTHQLDLQAIAPALQSVLRAHPEVTFVCFGLALPAGLAGLPNALAIEPSETARRDYFAYAEEIRSLDLDIGIAPLLDSEFNRCKSLIKLLEYGALGIPAVYAKTEPYQTGVEHGTTGLLAGDLDAWQTELEQLICHRDRRLAMGAAARRLVERRWLLPNGAEDWRAAWQQAWELAQHSPRPFERPPASDLIFMMQRVMDDVRQRAERRRWKAKIKRFASRMGRFFTLRSKQAA